MDTNRTKKPTVLVIGGINIDILVEPDGDIQPRTSMPGRISMSPGGVARNVAETLARLGAASYLIGAVGTSPTDREILDRLCEAGVFLDGIVQDSSITTGTYVSILDDGDLASAVADLSGTEGLTWEQVYNALSSVPTPDVVVVDCNLLGPVIARIVRWANDRAIPVVVEPVSVAKARRIVGLDGRIAVATPNEAEAIVLTEAATDQRPLIDHLFVTMGTEGVRYQAAMGTEGVRYQAAHADQRRRRDLPEIIYPTVAVTPVNANGAGDAFVAGMVWALLQGSGTIRDADERRFAVLAGLAAGALAVRSHDTTPRDISADRLLQEIESLSKQIPRDR